jgi:hypothetical protein
MNHGVWSGKSLMEGNRPQVCLSFASMSIGYIKEKGPEGDVQKETGIFTSLIKSRYSGYMALVDIWQTIEQSMIL